MRLTFRCRSRSWTVTLDGTQFSYTAGFFVGYTLADVATGLAAAINGNIAAGFHATQSGSTLSVTKNGGSSFTSAFTTSTGTITTAPFKVTATVTGAVVAGSKWTLTADATFSYTTGFGDDLPAVARQLGTMLPALATS